ncbi:MAG: hypothetical protein LV480_01510 [Methylacidiphilales bacterium]|nr:hypothetical protein [Candidatus Methylacidiphilales bacterium]
MKHLVFPGGIIIVIFLCRIAAAPLLKNVGAGWTAFILLGTLTISAFILAGISAALDAGQDNPLKVGTKWGFQLFGGWTLYMFALLVLGLVGAIICVIFRWLQRQ